jgi:hypothetical protein
MRTIVVRAFLASLGACLQNINIFIGRDISGSSGVPLSAYPDLLLETTIISPRDFACTEANDCSHSSVVKKMKYEGVELQYYDALAQLNVIKQPFTARYSFRYLVRDDNNFGSVVGFHKNSTFLDYLYTQDRSMGWTIIFRIEWNNTMTYKLGVYKADKLHVYYWLDANVTTSQNGSLSTKKMRVCMNNRLDKQSDKLSIMGVKTADYKYWDNLIANGGKENLVFDFYTPAGFNIGQMNFKYAEFVTPEGETRVKSFTPEFDEGRACDIYSGALMLKKYNFKFYYIEYQEGYEVKFGYDNFFGPEPLQVSNHINIIWKIIGIVIILAIIGVVYYKYIYNKRPAEANEHYGRVETDPAVELR